MSRRVTAAAPAAAVASALCLSLLLALCLGGCGPGAPAPTALTAPPTDPGEAALALMRLGAEPRPDAVALLFGPLPEGQARAALLDAIDALAPAANPRVVEVVPLEGLGRTNVEVVADRPGGEVRVALQVEPTVGDGLRIRWFQAPGVEWPTPARRRDEGLSSSAPPEPGSGL